MKILIQREVLGPDYAEGKLYINGMFFCVTLEDKDRFLEVAKSEKDKVYGQTAIPRGVYELKVDFSRRFKQLMPILVGVPGFSGVRIHAGNTPLDTDGCILVGLDRWKPGAILSSRTAFNRLMKVLESALAKGEDIYLEIM